MVKRLPAKQYLWEQVLPPSKRGTRQHAVAIREATDSRRRLLERNYKQGFAVAWPAAHWTPLRGWSGVYRDWILTMAEQTLQRLAQWVEHQTLNLAVTGSSPVPHRR